MSASAAVQAPMDVESDFLDSSSSSSVMDQPMLPAEPIKMATTIFIDPPAAPTHKGADTESSSSNTPDAQAALRAIGAQRLEDYVARIKRDAIAQREASSSPKKSNKRAVDPSTSDPITLSPSRREAAKKAAAAKAANGGVSPEGSSEKDLEPFAPSRPTSPGLVHVDSSSNLSSSSRPVDLLPITPSSRMGKRLQMSKNGSFEDIFNVTDDKSYVSQLVEFGQAAGLSAPKFTSECNMGIRCSPDHFVTLRFENHVFQDTDGRPSVKAGKEYVAKLALDYFFPGAASNGASSKANGSGLLLGNREGKDGPMRLDV